MRRAMNPTEMQMALEELAEQRFDPAAFPYAFLEAFGNKETTIARLRKTGAGSTNKTDLSGEPPIISALLQRNNIHLAICEKGQTDAALKLLAASPATAKQKAKFILATDGEAISAENCLNGEPLACAYADLADSFPFFMPLAGLSYSKELKESSFDMPISIQED